MSIEIYGRPMCDACEVAINIVESAGRFYQYYNVEQMNYEELTYVLRELAPGAKTVPIIIVNGRHIGDIDELREFFKPREQPENIMG